MPARLHKDGLSLDIRVTPKSSRDGVIGLRRGSDGAVSLAVRVRAAPEKGRANKAAIETLAKALGLPKSDLAVVAGEAGRDKTVRVSGNPQALEARIAAFLGGLNNGERNGENH